MPMTTATNEPSVLEPIMAGDPETRSADLVSGNVERLRELFPEAFTEDGIDFDTLRQLLGGAVVEREEKYGLNWHGKRQARQIALTPSTGTLLPRPEESVDWDTTQNLIIEGDNLEVLKLLQKSYAGKVKLIYIDPPYNTGKDFVYPDDYRDNLRNYLEQTSQVNSEGGKTSSNTEASGRFHTDWLNMMYPRLKLARNLLRDDGVLFVSIDSREIANLRALCNEVFGAECFIGDFVWRKKSSISYLSKEVLNIHEYILAYSRFGEVTLIDTERWQHDTTSVFHVFQSGNALRERIIRAGARLQARDITPTYIITAGSHELPSHTVEFLSDAHFDLGILQHDVVVRGRFVLGQEQLDRDPVSIAISPSGMMYYDKPEGPKPKPPLSIIENKQWVSRVATAELQDLFDGRSVFSYPKPKHLIRYLCHLLPGNDGICLDFFAGSGTTADAVLAQNSIDGGDRRFILVQYPEPLRPADKEQKEAAEFCDTLGVPRQLTELTKERVRRAGKKLRNESPLFQGDIGFRVLKLAPSNIRAWEPVRDDVEQSLLDHVDHILPGRTEQDVLYELLLKLGLDLTVPIEQRTIAGKTVHSVGGGVLLVCLAESVAREEVELLALGIVAWYEELAPAGDAQVVVRDAAFADDVARTNLAAILVQHGLERVRSL